MDQDNLEGMTLTLDKQLKQDRTAVKTKLEQLGVSEKQLEETLTTLESYCLLILESNQ